MRASPLLVDLRASLPDDGLRTYTRRDPPRLEALECHLGQALEEKGELAEASTELREAIRLRPDLVQAHNNLGNVLRKQRKREEAMAAFREAAPRITELRCGPLQPRSRIA